MSEQPLEQLPVEILGIPCLAVRAPDGVILLLMRDLCEAFRVSRPAQVRRLRGHLILNAGLRDVTVVTSGGPQTQVALELAMVPSWILTLSLRHIAPEVQVRIIHLQRYLILEVQEAFSRLVGLPRDSRAIEDLDDLNHIDTALTLLTDRQQTLEQSQQNARDAWRTMQQHIDTMRDDVATIGARMTILETQGLPADAPLTTAQRGEIYALVRAWGEAKRQQDATTDKRGIFAAIWGQLKARFRVARYQDIPAAQYETCVQFIRERYQAEIGEALTFPTQELLDL